MVHGHHCISFDLLKLFILFIHIFELFWSSKHFSQIISLLVFMLLIRIFLACFSSQTILDKISLKLESVKNHE